MELLWEIVGWIGAAAILGAYLAVSMGWLNAGRNFHTMNLVGAGAFILNASYHEAWPTVATNIAWGIISAVSLLRKGSSPKLSATEPVIENPLVGKTDERDARDLPCDTAQSRYLR